MPNNIFEATAEYMDLPRRIESIEQLFAHKNAAREKVLFDNTIFQAAEYDLSFEEAVDRYLFLGWPGRHGCESLSRWKAILKISTLQDITQSELHTYRYLEYVRNMLPLISRQGNAIQVNQSVMDALARDVEELASLSGQTFTEIDPECFVLCALEPGAMQAAAIADAEESGLLARYLHFETKDNLAAKKSILNDLSKHFESRKGLLDRNSGLVSDLGYLLNNLDIRHSNTKGPKKKPGLDGIPDEELIRWCDFAFNLHIEAMLEADRAGHKAELNDLKRRVGLHPEQEAHPPEQGS